MLRFQFLQTIAGWLTSMISISLFLFLSYVCTFRFWTIIRYVHDRVSEGVLVHILWNAVRWLNAYGVPIPFLARGVFVSSSRIALLWAKGKCNVLSKFRKFFSCWNNFRLFLPTSTILSNCIYPFLYCICFFQKAGSKITWRKAILSSISACLPVNNLIAHKPNQSAQKSWPHRILAARRARLCFRLTRTRKTTVPHFRKRTIFFFFSF